MEKIENFVIKNKIILSVVVAALLWVCTASVSHAATISVEAGNDVLNVDSTCTLSEAITNINAGNATAYPECTGTGAFGTNDTISLPSNKITLTNDLPIITESVTIIGNGTSSSVIDGDSDFKIFDIDTSGTGTTTARGFKLQAYRGVGLITNSGTTNISEIEVDGINAVSGPFNVSFGFFTDSSGGSYTVNIKDVYIHDIVDLEYNTNIIGLWFVTGSGSAVEANLENITVANISATSNQGSAQGIGVLNGPFQGGDSAQLDLTVKNATITNISSASSNVIGIGFTTFNDDTASSIHTRAKIINSTVTHISASGSAMISGAVAGATAGVSAGAHVGSTIELTNNLFADTGTTCLTADLSSLISSVTDAVVVNSITSGGGNVVDNNNCASYLTMPTDHNNITNLSSTLGPLSNNGGFVPTIALLANSPAVDAGVNVTGLAYDARGLARLQGTAFDSGAYESPFVKNSANSNTLASTGISEPLMYAAILGLTGISITLLKRSQLV